jgi:hypothetical protein
LFSIGKVFMNNLKVNKSTNKIQKARGTGKERFREE